MLTHPRTFHIRVTDSEKDKINRRAKKLNMITSKYIRRFALKGEVKDYSHLSKLIWQVNKIGNNINQTVKLMHTFQTSDDQDCKRLYAEFLKLKKLIEKDMK